MTSLGQHKSKKRKTTESTYDSKSIQTLENQLTASVNAKSSLNGLVDLLDIAESTEDAPLCSKAIFASYRVFILVINSGVLAVGREDSVRMWIQERLNSYVELLIKLLHNHQLSLRVCNHIPIPCIFHS